MTVAWDDMVVVGRIARPHGLRGHVIVEPETDFPEERFQPGNEVSLAPEGPARPMRVLKVATVRPHLGRLLVGFEGVATIDDAEALGRGELRVVPGMLRPLPPGQFYHHDLVGCVVVTRDDVELGRVARVEGNGAASLLVVRGRRGEVMVPLAEDICVAIDIAAQRIVVAPPEGLLDLNAEM